MTTIIVEQKLIQEILELTCELLSTKDKNALIQLAKAHLSKCILTSLKSEVLKMGLITKPYLYAFLIENQLYQVRNHNHIQSRILQDNLNILFIKLNNIFGIILFSFIQRMIYLGQSNAAHVRVNHTHVIDLCSINILFSTKYSGKLLLRNQALNFFFF